MKYMKYTRYARHMRYILEPSGSPPSIAWSGSSLDVFVRGVERRSETNLSLRHLGYPETAVT